MQKTKISWANYSSNPIRAIRKEDGKQGWACSKASEGCVNCYAETLNKKWGTKLLYNQANISKIDWFLNEREIQAWKKLKDPSKIFVVDMSDIFHVNIPDDFRHKIFHGMAEAPWHMYQILTKRPERMRDYFQKFPEELRDCMWLGTSVENKRVVDRVELLRQIPARIRWLSVEPLLESLMGQNIYDGINWIVVGAESGNHRRQYDIEWAREIRSKCRESGIPFFYKQGSHRFSGMERFLDGNLYEEFPSVS